MGLGVREVVGVPREAQLSSVGVDVEWVVGKGSCSWCASIDRAHPLTPPYTNTGAARRPDTVPLADREAAHILTQAAARGHEVGWDS